MIVRRSQLVQLLLVWVLLELAAAAQVEVASGGSLLARWVGGLVRPVSSVSEGLATGVSRAVGALGSTQRLLAENRRLRVETQFARAELHLLREDLRAARQQAEAAAAAVSYASRAVPARCVYRDVARGTMQVVVAGRSRVPEDTAVVGPGGVVGRVVRSRAGTCWVELLTHPAAAVAVQDDAGAVAGLAVGRGGGEVDIRFVPRTAPVVRGADLVTSGADGIYPAGLPVARVEVVRETEDPFLEIRGRLATDPATVRAVLLLVGADRTSGAGPQP